MNDQLHDNNVRDKCIEYLPAMRLILGGAVVIYGVWMELTTNDLQIDIICNNKHHYVPLGDQAHAVDDGDMSDEYVPSRRPRHDEIVVLSKMLISTKYTIGVQGNDVPHVTDSNIKGHNGQ